MIIFKLISRIDKFPSNKISDYTKYSSCAGPWEGRVIEYFYRSLVLLRFHPDLQDAYTEVYGPRKGPQVRRENKGGFIGCQEGVSFDQSNPEGSLRCWESRLPR